jgi:hypothetical protein
MGRPLNKKYFGTGPGMDFRVQANIGSGPTEGHIVRQRGSKRFEVNAGGDTGVCALVDKDIADLLTGEMTLSVRDLDDNILRVVKISAHKATLGDGSVVGWHFADATEDKVEIEEEADTFSDEEPE